MRQSALLLLAFLFAGRAGAQGHWPAWRGPGHDGSAPKGNPPVTWSEEQNVAWKTAIPGRGHSSPVVWGNRIFVTTAIPIGSPADPEKPNLATRGPGDRRPARSPAPTQVLQFTVVCLDSGDGRILWQTVVRETLPSSGVHREGSWANHSPVTDGKRVYAFFGSYGLHCLDMDGKHLWERDLGVHKTRNNFGEGTSPALWKDRLVLHCDHEGPSFVVAIDTKKGTELWRKKRDEQSSWSTPLIIPGPTGAQAVISATGRIRSYDVKNGDILWECGGMTRNVVPCLLEENGILYAISGFRGNALLAIRLDKARGDITDQADAFAWKADRNAPYVPSPVLHDGRLFFLKQNKGRLSCLDADTGEALYENQELPAVSGAYASPVAAAGRLYVCGLKGATGVVDAGPEFKILATNRLDEGFTASPAVTGDSLLLRGEKSLYCLRAE